MTELEMRAPTCQRCLEVMCFVGKGKDAEGNIIHEFKCRYCDFRDYV